MTRRLLKLERISTPRGEGIMISSTWNAGRHATFTEDEVVELCRELPRLFPEHFEPRTEAANDVPEARL